jgi:hypothetical protein
MFKTKRINKANEIMIKRAVKIFWIVNICGEFSNVASPLRRRPVVKVNLPSVLFIGKLYFIGITI